MDGAEIRDTDLLPEHQKSTWRPRRDREIFSVSFPFDTLNTYPGV